MYTLKNEEFAAIEKALNLIDFKSLSEKDQDIVTAAYVAMIHSCKAKKEYNKKVSSYIATKRITNKNYARPTKRKEEE